MDDPILILGGRKGGRPRVVQESTPISARIAARHHDLLIRLADERSTSVSAVVRGLIETACGVIERRQP
jgi:hypothetical protein